MIHKSADTEQYSRIENVNIKSIVVSAHNFFCIVFLWAIAVTLIGCTDRHISVQELSSSLSPLPLLPLQVVTSSDANLIGDLSFDVQVPESVSTEAILQLPWKISAGILVQRTCNDADRICTLKVSPNRQGVGRKGRIEISLTPMTLTDDAGLSVVRVHKSLETFEYNNAPPIIHLGEMNGMKTHTRTRLTSYHVTATDVERVSFYFENACSGIGQELPLTGSLELRDLDGTQSVFVRGRDVYGNETSCYQMGTVILDRQVPTVIVSAVAPNLGTLNTTFSTFLNFSESVELDNEKVKLMDSTTDCNLEVIKSSQQKYQVKVSGCTATGSARVVLQEGAGKDLAGSFTAATEVSFLIDNLGPLPPQNLYLGAIPDSLMQTPVIHYSSPVDQGHAGVENFQVQIEALGGSILKSWSAHVGGTAVLGLNLQLHQMYRLKVRAVDKLGNYGAFSETTWQPFKTDPCIANPAIGTVCLEGAIYAGTTTVETTAVRYMTTPSGCGDIPSNKRGGGSVAEGYWASADFTPSCNGGSDVVTKYWNNGDFLNYVVPGVFSAPSVVIEDWSGEQNTNSLSAIDDPALGGRYVAANYCAMLNYGGFTDWYLPSISEIDFLVTGLGSISGSHLTGRYWSSTQSDEGNNALSYQSGSVDKIQKHNNYLVRCIRKF